MWDQSISDTRRLSHTAWCTRQNGLASVLLTSGISDWRGIVVAGIYPSVRPSVFPPLNCTLSTLQFVTDLNWNHQFAPKCILGHSGLVLKIGVIDLDIQGHFSHFDTKCYEIRLVRVVCWHGFKLQWLNLHQIYILGFPWLALKMGDIDLELR